MMRAALTLGAAVLIACGGGEEPTFRGEPAALAAAEAAAPAPETVLPLADDEPRSADETPPNLDVLDRAAHPVVIAPGDLFTSTGNTSVTIAVPRRGLDEAGVRATAAEYELVTWPERAPVQTRVTYLDEALEHSPYARLSLEPESALRERWYAVRARPGPGERPAAEVAPADGDAVVARFQPGSSPVLRRVLARLRADGTATDVEVLFSEGVRLEASPFTVSADGLELECRLANPAALGRAIGSELAWLVCPPIAEGAGLGVLVRGAIYAASGPEVRSADGAGSTRSTSI
jgi:hypothetical protein